MKVLIVEDEPKTAAYLQKGLRENGFLVETTDCGETGLHLALTREHDIILLDVMLPGQDGWSIVAELRQSEKQTPVLFLTARDTIADRVKGLELGADDYLVEPFAFSELLARMRSLLRRGPLRQSNTVQIADMEIDLLEQRVLREGKRLDLAPREFALLSLLARRAGETLSRAFIAGQVWDIHFETDTNMVDVAIRRLRAKVDDPFTKKLIHTARGVGYILEERD